MPRLQFVDVKMEHACSSSWFIRASCFCHLPLFLLALCQTKQSTQSGEAYILYISCTNLNRSPSLHRAQSYELKRHPVRMEAIGRWNCGKTQRLKKGGTIIYQNRSDVGTDRDFRRGIPIHKFSACASINLQPWVLKKSKDYKSEIVIATGRPHRGPREKLYHITCH